jgi:hypothetical protein
MLFVVRSNAEQNEKTRTQGLHPVMRNGKQQKRLSAKHWRNDSANSARPAAKDCEASGDEIGICMAGRIGWR